MNLGHIVQWARRADTRWQRYRRPESRRILLDARTSMEYAVMAPVYRAMQSDPRLAFYFMASANPTDAAEIYREAGEVHLISPRRAALVKFDAYLAADLLWMMLPRGTRRIQMFHGVAGKYSTTYDRPNRSMREWDRLFFINRRRLQNYVAVGAIDADSPAARLVGMPKVDSLVDGSLERNAVLHSLGIDPSRQTVLYAPTWTPYSSLNMLGEELIRGLCAAGYAVIVKLHANSRNQHHLDGTDWEARLAPVLRQSGGYLARSSDACPYMVGADVLITDHSSVGFEYLLLDRPVVRIEMPELIARTNIPADYVAMLADVSMTVRNTPEVIAAVEKSFGERKRQSQARRAVAEELFYAPGSATARAVREMYEVLELELM